MSVDVDILVLGGGCAGLSLAARLAAAGERAPTTRVLDARETYTDDRTWCFWRTDETPFDDLIAAAWTRARVRTDGRASLLDCTNHPYVMLPAGRFWQRTRETIGASPRVSLDTGVRVGAVSRRADGGFAVETSAGTIGAAQIVDTRPAAAPRAGGALLWQSFSGCEIETNRDVFDASTADLMDFEPAEPGRVVFTYVLPRSPRRALVEITVFSAEPLGPKALAGDLARVLAARVGHAEHVVLRTEHGILPMGLHESLAPTSAPVSGPGYARAGVAGGAARPSSGYAFLRIQRWADACARAVRDGRPILSQPRDAAATRLMDRVFLRVLARDPARGPEMFARMFAGTPSDRLIRFLSDRGGLADHLALALSLPIGPFVREAPIGVVEETAAAWRARLA